MHYLNSGHSKLAELSWVLNHCGPADKATQLDYMSRLFHLVAISVNYISICC